VAVNILVRAWDTRRLVLLVVALEFSMPAGDEFIDS